MGKVKTEWPPCARCGTPDGAIYKRNLTPRRYSAVLFGMDGQLCDSCYTTLKRNPHAAISPHKRGPKAGRVKVEQLADAVLAFEEALEGNDPQRQATRLTAMLEMARKV